MKNKIHQCNYCGRSFSRKWNALRHNKLKHSNLARISGANFRSNQYSSRPHNKFYDYETKFKILGEVENKLNYYDLGIDFSYHLSANPVDIKIIKIIDQVIRPFEELETLLDQIKDETKAFILLNTRFSSLQNEEPVKSMYETVELYRLMKGTKKIIYLMSMMPKYTGYFEEPIEILKEKIKNSSIFERQNN